jgi:hypothetical protein
MLTRLIAFRQFLLIDYFRQLSLVHYFVSCPTRFVLPSLSAAVTLISVCGCKGHARFNFQARASKTHPTSMSASKSKERLLFVSANENVLVRAVDPVWWSDPSEPAVALETRMNNTQNHAFPVNGKALLGSWLLRPFPTGQVEAFCVDPWRSLSSNSMGSWTIPGSRSQFGRC